MNRHSITSHINDNKKIKINNYKIKNNNKKRKIRESNCSNYLYLPRRKWRILPTAAKPNTSIEKIKVIFVFILKNKLKP